MAKRPTKRQLQAFGEYVYRCDPDGFERWLEDERGDYETDGEGV